MNETQHAIRLGALLVVLWLVLSGHYGALLLSLGAASCALALFLALRMDRVDGEAIPLAMRAVALGPIHRLARGRDREVEPRRWRGSSSIRGSRSDRPCSGSKATQRTLLGHVVYANSITLTPGTVSIDLHGDAIDVHSLLDPDLAALGEMDRRVSGMERPGSARRSAPEERSGGVPGGAPGGALQVTGFGMGVAGIGAAAVLAAMCLTMFRALKGPTVYDRILAVNHFGTLTVLLIAAAGLPRPAVPSSSTSPSSTASSASSAPWRCSSSSSTGTSATPAGAIRPPAGES